MLTTNRYIVDLKQLATTVATIAGSGIVTTFAPPALRGYALAFSATILALLQGPIQKTPAAYVEDGAAVLEKWLPLLSQSQQKTLKQRVAAINALVPVVEKTVGEADAAAVAVKTAAAQISG